MFLHFTFMLGDGGKNISYVACALASLHHNESQESVLKLDSYGITLRLSYIMYLSLTNSCAGIWHRSAIHSMELQLSIETMCLTLNTSPALQINQPWLMFKFYCCCIRLRHPSQTTDILLFCVCACVQLLFCSVVQMC